MGRINDDDLYEERDTFPADGRVPGLDGAGDGAAQVQFTRDAIIDAGSGTYPSPIVVPGATPWHANTNWSNLQFTASNDIMSMRRISNGTQGRDITWRLFGVPAGTFTLTLMHARGSNVGIYHLTLDGSAPTALGGSADTIDGYAASGTPTFSDITGIVLPAHLSDPLDVTFTMDTKNASSSAYYGVINAFMLTRTA